jgi:RND family efflux transporter MFP subunit
MTEAQRQTSGGAIMSGRKKSPIFMALFIGVAILVIFGVLQMFHRRSQYSALAKENEAESVPTVAIIHPTVATGDEKLVLPGTLQAYVEAPIYARTNGYLRKWYHDIGSRVNKGDILADIDSPEVDQQLSQAKADRGTAQANVNLSDITAKRYADLLSTDSVSKQEVDNAKGDQAAKKAMLESAGANVRRLEELESFKHVYAPFSGVITRRNVDIGTLINAGNGGSAQQLFFLAQTDPIRVFVNVPESYAAAVKAGLGAYLELTQYPGQKFEGKVARTAESIDLATRTLLTEIDVPNKSGILLPGGYAQAHLEVSVSGAHLQVPVNSLLFRSEGLRAVVIDENKRTHMQPLTIGRDYGTTLEVLDGLKVSDWIVLNPPDALEDNVVVRVKEVKNPTSAGTVAAPAAGAKPQAPANQNTPAKQNAPGKMNAPPSTGKKP